MFFIFFPESLSNFSNPACLSVSHHKHRPLFRIHLRSHSRFRSSRFPSGPLAVLPARFGSFQGSYTLFDALAYLYGFSLFLVPLVVLFREICLILASLLWYRHPPPWLFVWLLFGSSISYGPRLYVLFMAFLISKTNSWYLFQALSSAVSVLGYHRLLQVLNALLGLSHRLNAALVAVLDGTSICLMSLGWFYGSIPLLFKPKDDWNVTNPDLIKILNQDFVLASLSGPCCIPVSPKGYSAQFRPMALQALQQAGQGSKHILITFDTGASRMSTGYQEDFISFKATVNKNLALDGIAAGQGLTIAGQGICAYKVTMDDGTAVILHVEALFVPGLKHARLMSPQGIRTSDGHPCTFLTHSCLPSESLSDSYGEFWVKPKTKDWKTQKPLYTLKVSYDPRDLLPKHFMAAPQPSESNLMCLAAAMDVTHQDNQNLSPSQKELLRWHFRLGHIGFNHVRWLIRSGFLSCSNPKAVANCEAVKCACCEYGTASKRSHGSTVTRQRKEKEMELKKEDLLPGQRVSVDHYQSTQPGRLYSSRGGVGPKSRFVGGAVFVDHASGLIKVMHQVSLDAVETIKSKLFFEKEAWQDGVKIQAYHTDNGVFTSKAFLDELITTNQRVRFSGSGAAHQNGVAERGILTVVSMARKMLLHAAMRNPSIQADHWPMAMDYAVWLYNHIPRMDSGLSPLELWSRSRSLDLKASLQNCHVWGAPTFVLDPKLRKGGVKIPKWAPRSRQGVFMGFSRFHSGLIGLVLNKVTGTITPQFHCVFDDGFTTVPSPQGTIDQASWTQLITSPNNRLQVLLDATDDPDIGDEWLDPTERTLRDAQRREHAVRHPWTQPDPGHFRWQSASQYTTDPIDSVSPSASSSFEREKSAPLAESVPLGDLHPLSTNPFDPVTGNPTTHTTVKVPADRTPLAPTARPDRTPLAPTARPGLLKKLVDHNNPGIKEERAAPAPVASPGSLQSITQRPKRHPKQRELYTSDFRAARDWKSGYVANLATQLQKGVWTAPQWSKIADYLLDLDSELTAHYPLQDSFDNGSLHSVANKASKKKASDPDAPNYFEAMSGDNAQAYWAAMLKEITDLEKRKTWKIVERTKPRSRNQEIVPGTWAFKAKRFPDGRFRKFKARFCVRGDVQKLRGGGDVCTFAPVVSWVTVRLLLILSLILSLKNTQIDFSNAFAQADLVEHVYLDLPRGFNPEGAKSQDYCLELQKSLYGQVDAPRLWYEKLRAGLEERGFTCYENLDPCLFVKDDCIAFCYVDDLCFFYHKPKVFQDIIQSFKDDGDQYNWELTVEGEVNSYLGICIEKTQDGGFQLTQAGLVDKILKTTNMDDCNAKRTPCSGDGKPLSSDKNGSLAHQDWNYRSVIGMLLYLASNSRPDIAFAVHQCARFSHAPKASHEAAVIRICRYLKGTRKDGLILRPSKDLQVICHVDADFCGLYGVEDPEDPICAKSRTGYVILIANCPLMWVSKLQTEHALSTQHSEYIALSTACRDLLPIRELVNKLVQVLGLTNHGLKFTAQATCFEDNAACLALAKLRRLTPQNRHIAAKYHWFRSYVKGANNPDAFLDIEKVDTKKQLADCLTKNLQADSFERARDLLCGW